jgi:hypothetical protein
MYPDNTLSRLRSFPSSFLLIHRTNYVYTAESFLRSLETQPVKNPAPPLVYWTRRFIIAFTGARVCSFANITFFYDEDLLYRIRDNYFSLYTMKEHYKKCTRAAQSASLGREWGSPAEILLNSLLRQADSLYDRNCTSQGNIFCCYIWYCHVRVLMCLSVLFTSHKF